MLIALMTILFLGGGSTSAVLGYIEDATDSVKQVVTDDDRRDAAIDTLQEAKKLAKEQDKARKAVFKQLKEDLAEHTVTEDVSEAAWDDFYSLLRENNAAAVDLRFELREHLTREEWEQVYSRPGT